MDTNSKELFRAINKNILTNELRDEMLNNHNKWLEMPKKERRKKAYLPLRFKIDNTINTGWNVTDFERTNLSYAVFENNTLNCMNFKKITATNTTFTNMRLYSCDFSNAQISQTTFTDTVIDNSISINTSFYKCKFVNVTFTRSLFFEMWFENCEFVNCTFKNNNTFLKINTKNSIGFPVLSCKSCMPSDGAFIGWKTVKDLITDKIVVCKLEIPANAKRVNAVDSRKCRADRVKTLALYTIGGRKFKNDFILNNRYKNRCIYKIGKITKSDGFTVDNSIDCGHGIHFFITKDEAIEYAENFLM